MEGKVTVMQTGEDAMDHDTKKTALALLGIPTLLMIVVIVAIPLNLFNAWVVQKMYIWFLLPLHAPRLNLWHIWGITMLITLLTGPHAASADGKSDKAAAIGKLIGYIIGPLIGLLVAYFIKGHIGY